MTSSPVFLKMGQPRPLFYFISSFQTHITIFQQINVKNVHPIYGAGIHTHESRPLEHESPPITTRPGALAPHLHRC